jgi:hypothetical protein
LPSIDGKIYLADAPDGVTPGTFARVKVTQASDYDLAASFDPGAPLAAELD